MTPEQAEELSQKLIAAAAADRMGVSKFDNRNVFLLAEALSKTLSGKAVIKDATIRHNHDYLLLETVIEIYR